MDQTLIQEILEVVEQAAIASAKLSGKGLKNEADAAAVEAMRKRMGQIQMQGRIVIGEGERDEAPMLYIGEEVGSGTGPGVDFAVDPCEGTNLCAFNQRGSMAVLAASDRGGLFNAPLSTRLFWKPRGSACPPVDPLVLVRVVGSCLTSRRFRATEISWWERPTPQC